MASKAMPAPVMPPPITTKSKVSLFKASKYFFLLTAEKFMIVILNIKIILSIQLKIFLSFFIVEIIIT
jgi:hypothetical protein